MEDLKFQFFSKEENLFPLKQFLMKIETINYVHPLYPDVIGQLKVIFAIIINNASTFDKYCSVNIEWIGRRFIEEVKRTSALNLESSYDSVLSIFSVSYRFICELEFSHPDDLNTDLRIVKNFVEQNLDKFPAAEKQRLIYASYLMPVNIAKEILHGKGIREFMDYSNIVKTAKNLKEEWDKEIESKSEEIKALKDGLDRVTTTYNFVGLVKGFESLADTKRKEKNRSFISLVTLGILMTFPVIMQLGFTVSHIDTIESHKNTLIYSLPPLIALEVILLYFFRVVLSQFRGIASQLLQINLRITLCQFIQSYSEYSTKIKKQDASALEKFENLIFGSINFSTEALPSTFDGMDQIAKLINSIRSGK